MDSREYSGTHQDNVNGQAENAIKCANAARRAPCAVSRCYKGESYRKVRQSNGTAAPRVHKGTRRYYATTPPVYSVRALRGAYAAKRCRYREAVKRHVGSANAPNANVPCFMRTNVKARAAPPDIRRIMSFIFGI